MTNTIEQEAPFITNYVYWDGPALTKGPWGRREISYFQVPVWMVKRLKQRSMILIQALGLVLFRREFIGEGWKSFKLPKGIWKESVPGTRWQVLKAGITGDFSAFDMGKMIGTLKDYPVGRYGDKDCKCGCGK